MMQWILPFGAFSGPNWMGLYARRHMHEYGTTREQIAQISLNARRNAALNPKAVLTKELTLDDYMSSPMISDPLCLYDCDIAIDGATAVVISDAAYAPDTPHPAIHFEAVGQRTARPRVVGSVGGHDHHRGDERGQAPLVEDRSEAQPTSTSPSSTTASPFSACTGSRECSSAARARAARSSRAASASA